MSTLCICDLQLTLDRASPDPLYLQTAHQLEQRIRSGEIPAGMLLGSEVAFAESIGLSRPTMRQALRILVDKGLLVRQRGIGTQVVANTFRPPSDLILQMNQEAGVRRGPDTMLLSETHIAADNELADHLAVAPGEHVLHLQRIRHLNGQPLAVLHNFLPERLFDIETHRLQHERLHLLIRRYGVKIPISKRHISARLATPDERTHLGLPRGHTVVAVTQTTYDNSGKPVEHGRRAYRSDLYSFDLTLVAR